MMYSAGGDGSAVAVAAAVVVVALLWVATSSQIINGRRRRRRLPPGPPPLPIVGNLLTLVGGELPHRALQKVSQKYGPIVFLKLGAVPAILVSDSRLARACLSGQNDKIFAGRPPMEATRRLIFDRGHGIAMTPFGEEWRQARRLCSLQLFTTRRVREFEPLRRTQILALMRKIDQQAGDPVDLTHAIASLTEAMTCKMLLGKSLVEIADVAAGTNMQALVQRVTELFQAPIIGDFIPTLGFLDRKAKAALDEVHARFDLLLSKLIADRQQRPPGSPQVILDVLVENLELGRAKTIMLELLAASLDTSATTLDWAMAELMGRPEAMRKLQEELDSAEKSEEGVVEEETLERLAYMKAVVKETMRLHPPAPLLIPHMATQECEVGGYRIPEGCRLFVNAWAIGRDPTSWPHRPATFDPDRFLHPAPASLLDVRGQHYELLPFGTGRRICPGMPIALPLVCSALASLVLTFDWSLPAGHALDLTERFGTVVARSKPLWAVPHRRHRQPSTI